MAETTRYLDERLVEVLQALPKNLASAMRPNLNLDAVMEAQTAAPAPLQSNLRVNDMLDVLMGLQQSSQSQQQPTNYPLVPYAGSQPGGNAANDVGKLSDKLDLVISAQGPDNNESVGLLGQLVAVGWAISQQLDQGLARQQQTTLPAPSSGQAAQQVMTNNYPLDLPEATPTSGGMEGCCHLLGELVGVTTAILQKLDACCTGGALPAEKEEEEPEKEKTWGDWLKEKWGHVKTIGKGFADPNELRGTGTSMAGAGALVGLPGVGKFVDGIFKGADALKQWNEMLRQNNLRFAEFSAGMAGVAGESEARRIQMMQQQGDQRAPWARKGEEAGDKFDNLVGKFETTIGNVRNMVRTGLFEGIDAAADAVGIKKGMDELNKWLGSLAKDEDREKDFEALDKLSDWDYALAVLNDGKQQKHRPARFAGAGGAAAMRGRRQGP